MHYVQILPQLSAHAWTNRRVSAWPQVCAGMLTDNIFEHSFVDIMSSCCSLSGDLGASLAHVTYRQTYISIKHKCNCVHNHEASCTAKPHSPCLSSAAPCLPARTSTGLPPNAHTDRLRGRMNSGPTPVSKSLKGHTAYSQWPPTTRQAQSWHTTRLVEHICAWIHISTCIRDNVSISTFMNQVASMSLAPGILQAWFLMHMLGLYFGLGFDIFRTKSEF